MSAAKKKVFHPGDRVFAKVRGYPAWPARVETEGTGGGASTKYSVFFFGTYETAVVKRDDLFPYDEGSKKRFGNQKRKGFDQALHEIENDPQLKTAEQLAEIEAEALAVQGGDAAEAAPGQDAPAGEAEADKPEETAKDVAAAEAVEKPVTPAKAAPAKATPKAKATAASSAKKTPARGAAKRKAEEADVATPPPAKAAKGAAASSQAATPATPTPSDTPSEERVTSRSGRVIKPKKFVDDMADSPQHSQSQKGEDSTPRKRGAPAAAAAATPTHEARKMFVQVKATGDMVEINLDRDRPLSFDSKDAEVQWERATAKNALKFKEKVEKGEFIPHEVRVKLEAKVHRTPEEEEILKKERQLGIRKEKVRWLKTEQKLIDLDISIKQSLHYRTPDMPRCLEALAELAALPWSPLMLKKQSDIVATLRKLRKYVGPPVAEDARVGEEWTADAQKIRLQANQIFMKMQSAFVVPDGQIFWEAFEAEVLQFREATKGMERSKVLSLVSDPVVKKSK